MGGFTASNVQRTYPLSLPLQQGELPLEVTQKEHSVPLIGTERPSSSGNSFKEDRGMGVDSRLGIPQVSPWQHPVSMPLEENTVSSGAGSSSEEFQWRRDQILLPQHRSKGRNNEHRNSWYRRPVVSIQMDLKFCIPITSISH